MIHPCSFVPPASQLEHNPSVLQLHFQRSELCPSETRVASTFILPASPMQEQDVWQLPGGPTQSPSYSFLPISNTDCSGSHFSDTHLYSTPVDQVNLDPAGVEDHPFAFSDVSIVSNFVDSAFVSLNPTHDDISWASPDPEYCPGLVFVEEPAMNSDSQDSDETPGYFIPSTSVALPTSYETNLDFQTTSLGQGTKTSFQATDPYPSPRVDILPLDWVSNQPATHLLVENPITSNPADLAVGVYGSSYPGENSREVDYEAVQSLPHAARTLEQQLVLYKRHVSFCGWKFENGTVCGEPLTLASLPAHLSTHGIKNMSRDCLTKCNWIGCKRKKSMNRESIVRHIREVHLRLRRSSSSKRMQNPCF